MTIPLIGLNFIGAGISVLIFFLILAIIILAANVRVVPQATVMVIERLGTYHKTWQAGLHFKVPFIDRIAARISLKEQVADFNPQAVITKDNVTMQIDTVIFFQVTDPILYCYGIENPIMAIDNLSSTTLRNIIGDLELDDTLTSRDIINNKMREILDEATDPWGIKVNRVELKNILPPNEIQQAMEKQMKAERERREAIIIADGHKEANVRTAEGEKQAKILRAEADKEAEIRAAEGEAEAIRLVYEAKAKGMERLKSVQADTPLLALRSMEAMENVANGQATKIIIPSEMQDLAGVVASVQALTSTKDPELKMSPASENKKKSNLD